MAATFLLAGCKSSEERAEERYQSGLALIEEGDLDRAIVEFRSVFQLDPNHREARRALADLLLEHKGNRQGAYNQYLRLAEQYPDDADTRIILTELAFLGSNWDEVERHGDRAEQIAPEDPRVEAIKTVRAYRAAVLAEDDSARREHARTAQTLLDTQPENELLRSIVIDNHMRENELTQALAGLDWMLERNPDDLRLWRQRLNVLAQLEDYDAMEDQLRRMITQFEDDDSHKATLIRFYMSRDEGEKAEAYLRELASASEDIAPRIDLIRFLAQTRGLAEARAEVDAALKDHPGNVQLRILGAGMDFSMGQRDAAIASMETILEEAPESEFASDARVALAQMLLQTGNEVGARARVEEALAENPDNAAALKMRAAWLIESDDTDGAISALRTALDSAPEDAEAMTLMAQAYARSGREDLERDFLALAVEASGNAPTETIRYARRLIAEERYLPAEDILLPALRLAPQNPDLLVTLGRLYLEMEDMARVEQVTKSLRELDMEAATLAANQLEAERINRQSGPADAIAYLTRVAEDADASLASKVLLARAQISTGNIEAALELGRDLVAENPDNLDIKNVLAVIEAAAGNLDTAESIYEEILAKAPTQAQIWLELSRIKSRQGDVEAARAVIEQGMEAAPDDPNLLWAKASMAEQDGDIETAIAIYEDLYERNSDSVVIANNLASLLSSHRTEEADLQRAETIARRLRNVETPAIQDTYGWITHRRGNSKEALPYLEAAAEGLPRDALVQYHLAEVYRALGRTEEALAAYRAAVSVAGAVDSRPQIAEARTRIAELESAAPEEASEDATENAPENATPEATEETMEDATEEVQE